VNLSTVDHLQETQIIVVPDIAAAIRRIELQFKMNIAASPYKKSPYD
jgi:hypothetical protein